MWAVLCAPKLFHSLFHSWVNEPSYQSKNVGPQSPDEGVFGQDTIHLYTHFFETDPAWQTNFANMPVKVNMNGSSRPDTFGLGPQSTLLQKMWSAGMISSRSFSFYLGTGFDRAHGVINGSTVFGGYDAGRFEGTVHNYTLAENTANPFQVHVSSITLDDPSGIVKNVPLIDGDGFDAQISAEQYPMSLPSDVTQRFINTLAAEPTDSDDGSLRVTKPFNGTMTITLSDGFSIKLAPEVIANVSGISPVAQQKTDATGPFILGGSWLSQVYLMANYDDGSFHLAQAVPEAKFIITKTMCPRVTPQPYTPPKVGFVKGGLVGAVVGGVIGGSALVTVAICLCLNWMRKRNQKKVRYFDGKKGGVKIHQFDIEDDELDGPRRPWRKVGRSARKL
jgi:hypothetical protein